MGFCCRPCKSKNVQHTQVRQWRNRICRRASRAPIQQAAKGARPGGMRLLPGKKGRLVVTRLLYSLQTHAGLADKSQLRCSGEPEGCQRCLARSIECVYLSQRASPAGHRRQSSTATLASSDISSISTLAPSTAEETSQDKLMMWGDDDVWNYTEGLDDMQWPGATVMNRASIVTLEGTCRSVYMRRGNA